MIKEFVNAFMNRKEELAQHFRDHQPGSYTHLVTEVVRILSDEGEYYSPDVDRITTIDHGDYQGTKLFIIGESGYQPSTYWAASMSYGSCSCCDTFESIRSIGDWGDDGSTDEQVERLMTLALHFVQNLKVIS